MAEALSGKRLRILEVISDSIRERGYPPSVREIAAEVGLSSTASVQNHLAVLQREGYLRRDPTKPRAIQVHYEASSQAAMAAGPVRHVPLVGDVAAGTGVLAHENVEEVMALPEQFTGTGPSFALRVRGDSMIEAGILHGDYLVVRRQEEADTGDVVVAGIPDDEATVKRFGLSTGKVILTPANQKMSPMTFDPDDVTIFGKVISVIRRL